jgi:hypothetical protein
MQFAAPYRGGEAVVAGSPNIGRYDDIWAGYVVLAIADHLDHAVAFGFPVVKQVRQARAERRGSEAHRALVHAVTGTRPCAIHVRCAIRHADPASIRHADPASIRHTRSCFLHGPSSIHSLLCVCAKVYEPLSVARSLHRVSPIYLHGPPHLHTLPASCIMCLY